MTARGHIEKRHQPKQALAAGEQPHHRTLAAIGALVAVRWRPDQLAALNAYATRMGVPFSEAARRHVDVGLALKRLDAYEVHQDPALPNGSLTDVEV